MNLTPHDLTRQHVLQSLQSEVCPACGNYKIVRRSVCGGCWRKLSQSARSALYRKITDGYRESLIHALGLLGCREPVLPGDPRVGMIQQGELNRDKVTAEICRRSLGGPLCPACQRGKNRNVAWCAVCVGRLRPKVDRLIPHELEAIGLFEEKLETVDQIFDPARLKSSPSGYCESFYLAMHALDCSRIYLPREQRA